VNRFSFSTEAHEKTAITASQWKNPYPDDQFTVGVANGFLPREDPLVQLPKEYAALESLLQRMSLQQPDGSPGLLMNNKFGNAVKEELPEYDVSSVTDTQLLSGKFMI
jgi:indoleamine 2,3-dioxygenase